MNTTHHRLQGKEGSPPPERSKGFADSGYYVLRGSWTDEPYEDGLYLLFDCGPLGFGSHGHYDLLNFEAAACGHSLIVDPGRYTYSEDSSDSVNWRRVFKGTAYHNTVTVDGKDQIPYCLGARSPGATGKVENICHGRWVRFHPRAGRQP